MNSLQSRGRESSFEGYWYEPLLGTPYGYDDAARQAEIPEPTNGRADLGHQHATGPVVRELSGGSAHPGSGAQAARPFAAIFGGDAAVPEAKGLAILPATGARRIPNGTSRPSRGDWFGTRTRTFLTGLR